MIASKIRQRKTDMICVMYGGNTKIKGEMIVYRKEEKKGKDQIG